MKKAIIGIILVTLLAMFVFAAEADEIAEGKQLVDSKIACDKLSEDQLEVIGEYFMEQMHPSESHESMNKMMVSMMGEEGEVQMHVQLARAIYCGEKTQGMEMMPMMGMMGPGMMKGYGDRMIGPGMMSWAGPWGTFGGILSTILFIGLILLVWLAVIKLWKEVFRKK